MLTLREIRDVDEARGWPRVGTELVDRRPCALPAIVEASDRDPHVYRNTRRSPSRPAGQYSTR